MNAWEINVTSTTLIIVAFVLAQKFLEFWSKQQSKFKTDSEPDNDSIYVPSAFSSRFR